jgi:hypothetical protein
VVTKHYYCFNVDATITIEYDEYWGMSLLPDSDKQEPLLLLLIALRLLFCESLFSTHLSSCIDPVQGHLPMLIILYH